jgi:hypothetical protein
MENLAQALRASADTVAGLGASAADIAAIGDTELLLAQAEISAHRRHLDTYAAWVAGEIARRSRYELGYAGLAQRKGFVSPEALIQSVSKTTKAEAAKFVQVGSLMTESALAESCGQTHADPSTDPATDAPSDPATDPASGDGSSGSSATWHSAIAVAVAAGDLSVDAAESIRRGLGAIDDAVTPAHLREACELLVAEARTLDADQLFRRARALRDRLDADGIARRQKERHDARYLRMWQQDDGMYRGSFLLDPENGRFLASTIDQVLSPRRGGPRFVDRAAQADAEALLQDARSSEQIAADTLIDIVRVAVDADPGTMFGKRRPAVRVIVTEEALHARSGHGQIEGHPDPVSFETVERYLCDTGAVPIKFDDDGQCVNVGRVQRLFTERQRTGMAVRDGGCRFPGCDRPPVWCEAHHIDQWQRDGGKTNIADGILLCRRHHLLLHNNHWQVTRDGGTYWLRPPRAIDPAQELLPMPRRSPLLDELLERNRAS